jgi:hypothetical protein
MRQPNLFELELVPSHFGQDQIQVTAWINHSRLTCLVVPNQRTILLKGCDRNGLVLKHGDISIGFKTVRLQANANT